MTINARTEFCNHVAGKKKVIAAEFTFVADIDEAAGDDGEIDEMDEPLKHTLFVDYTEEEWLDFLAQLDFEYDNGYGAQYLFGKIWYDDESFSVRGEYDGSEWWKHVVRPKPPTRDLKE